jgi:curved DNA-binding protein CbpA
MSESRDGGAGALEGRIRVADALRALGVDDQASPAQLRHAFHEAALRYHPDRAGPPAADRFREAQAAYRLLIERARRAQAQGVELRDRPSDRAQNTASPAGVPIAVNIVGTPPPRSDRGQRSSRVEPLLPREAVRSAHAPTRPRSPRPSVFLDDHLGGARVEPLTTRSVEPLVVRLAVEPLVVRSGVEALVPRSGIEPLDDHLSAGRRRGRR